MALTISLLVLALSLLFGLCGMLAVTRARILPLFFVAVAANELGHFLAIPAMAFAIFLPNAPEPFLAARVIFALSALALWVPTLRAVMAASGIRAQMSAAFHSCDPAFSFVQLWRKPVPHQQIAERLSVPGGCNVDFFRAHTGTPAPLVVVAHGGGWIAGDSTEFAGWNRWLADHGFAVASVDYRLVPAATWPGQRDDMLGAIEFLRTNAVEFHIAPARVALLGRSAGGQIVSAMAAHDAPSWLRGCVCFYTPFDMLFAYELGREDDMLQSRKLVRDYLGGPPDAQPENYRDASAYLSANSSATPFLLLHGRRDELVWFMQSERFSKRLAELGVHHANISIPSGVHAFDYNIHGPGGQAAAACLLSFLRDVLR